ncbi:minor capsid protein [Enterococcus sp. AZ163]|uniref:minor capsid protein n=1 Tax=Enterococcus sp. AZ163 TaxID=2774638 RepID=UPI003D2E4EC1
MAKITVDLSGVRSKLSDAAMDRGRYAMGNQMISDMHPYVPKRSGGGALRASVHLSGDSKSITYQMPYARAQFYGTNGKVVFRKYSTPGTGKRWDLKAKALHLPSWKRAFLKGAGF